eukprot:CAMPEP_0206520296 /NCGR_PEP_ID=MMETSP0324_2-20121206/65678_1 /ASSEMBLY_ACC=CAM_ASM_000836 /TAXON_ID=2866 /ORGANISM="Crypthecodinium cohnii, Strain Seligo" /LENGTH=170 /DNA_ID=CAMNT_0054013993 /DNA_START=80 /DNA_END=588 /DNA_ORIENTATION=-
MSCAAPQSHLADMLFVTRFMVFVMTSATSPAHSALMLSPEHSLVKEPTNSVAQATDETMFKMLMLQASGESGSQPLWAACMMFTTIRKRKKAPWAMLLVQSFVLGSVFLQIVVVVALLLAGASVVGVVVDAFHPPNFGFWPLVLGHLQQIEQFLGTGPSPQRAQPPGCAA